MGLTAKYNREEWIGNNTVSTGEVHDIDISAFVAGLSASERAIMAHQVSKPNSQDLDFVAEANGFYKEYGAPGTVIVDADEFAEFVKDLPKPPYLVSDSWGHILDNEVGEVMIQWVYDTVDEIVVAANVQHDRALDKWTPATRDELADIEDHLKNANPDALDNPLEWDVEYADELPEWAHEPSASPKI
jgi:hypothetical protein